MCHLGGMTNLDDLLWGMTGGGEMEVEGSGIGSGNKGGEEDGEGTGIRSCNKGGAEGGKKIDEGKQPSLGCGKAGFEEGKEHL